LILGLAMETFIKQTICW